MPVPRIQRAFMAWLDEARPRLKRQVILGKRTRSILEFTFDVGAPFLKGWVNSFELTIGAFPGETDDFWDLISDDYATPVRLARGGFLCRCCAREGKRCVYANRDDLWREHLFEPFGAWVNEKLAPAAALALFQSGGITWAKLVQSEAAEGAAIIVPLR